MSLELPFKIVSLLRLLAFMVIVYLALGLLVERYSTNPESQVKAFFRTVCSPITRPVSRLVAPGSSHARVLWASLGVVTAFWAVTVILSKVLRPA